MGEVAPYSVGGVTPDFGCARFVVDFSYVFQETRLRLGGPQWLHDDGGNFARVVVQYFLELINLVVAGIFFIQRAKDQRKPVAPKVDSPRRGRNSPRRRKSKRERQKQNKKCKKRKKK